MSYQLLEIDQPTGELPRIVKRMSDDGSVLFIPMANGNRDFEEYKAWLAAGNTPLLANP